MLATLLVAAQLASFGDWNVVDGENNTFVSGTVNDSGNIFSYYCSAKDAMCYWGVSMAEQCETGAQYPVLINVDDGASYTLLICEGTIAPGVYKYSFTNFETMKALTQDAGRMGIAFPLKDGAFRVLRFSMRGFASAKADTENRAIQASKNATTNLTL